MHPGAEDPFRSSNKEYEAGSHGRKVRSLFVQTSYIKILIDQVGGKKGYTWLDSLKIPN